MVIDTNVLIKLMARDYKRSSGYTVSKDNSLDASPTLYMHGDDWAVQIEWAKVPEKVLAKIVEHMRDLPGMCEAFTIKRNEEPTSVSALKYHFPELPELGNRIEIKRTPLIYDSFSVWQKPANKGCSLLGADTAEMLYDHGRRALAISGGVYLEGKISRGYVDFRTFPAEDKRTLTVQKLSEREWV